MHSDIDRAVLLLLRAIRLLQNTGRSQRRQEWFKPSGHLTSAGVAYLQGLFNQGMSTHAAAKHMGISRRTAALRRPKKVRRTDDDIIEL